MDNKLEDPFFFTINLQLSLATMFLDWKNLYIYIPCRIKCPFAYYLIWRSRVHGEIWLDHRNNVRITSIHLQNGFFNLRGIIGLCVRDINGETLFIFACLPFISFILGYTKPCPHSFLHTCFWNWGWTLYEHQLTYIDHGWDWSKGL